MGETRNRDQRKTLQSAEIKKRLRGNLSRAFKGRIARHVALRGHRNRLSRQKTETRRADFLFEQTKTPRRTFTDLRRADHPRFSGGRARQRALRRLILSKK